MSVSFRKLIPASMLFWVLITFVGIFYVYNIKKYVSFGIDLVGGMYLTLEVDVDKAVESELLDEARNLQTKLEKDGIQTQANVKIENGQAVLTFSDSAQALSVYQKYGSTKSDVNFSTKDDQLIISLSQSLVERIKREAVEGNIRVLHARLDEFSVAEIPIAAAGTNRIVIELPDVKDQDQAKAKIGKAALLELKVVEDAGYSEQDLLEKFGGILPEGMVILPGKSTSRRGVDTYYLVPKYTDLTGRLLKDAKVGLSDRGLGVQHGVTITFNTEGADRFYDMTRKNVGKPIAIIIDGVVISAPRVSEPIKEGNAIITFGDSGSSAESIMKEAQDLANMLKSGAFVAPVRFAEERIIGSSLGKESIQKGFLSCAISLVLLFLFSIIFYKTSGILAFIVLLYNLLLILLGLIWLRATLTMPGIAGMVLTIGMAIDSSVLIFERIREELAAGVSMRKAVDTGFKDAMVVILDSNMTHFLVGAVLYLLGSGPIQGFAITLMLGIVSTLATGLLLLRTLFNFVLDTLRFDKISI